MILQLNLKMVLNNIQQKHYQDYVMMIKVVENETEFYVHFIKYVSMSPQKFYELKKQNESDKEMIEFKRIINEKWPTSKTNPNNCLKQY